MPVYTYHCDLEVQDHEVTHSMADCQVVQYCPDCGMPMSRVIRKAPQAFFLGPGFACNDNVAKPNVGRNPNNQNRYSDGK